MGNLGVRLAIGLGLMLSQFYIGATFAQDKLQPQLIVDAIGYGFHYAYAPSIIKADGKYHVFFCSTATPESRVWDFIRHVDSSDGVHWSSPKIMLRPNRPMGPNNGHDLAACDPSVVFYQGFYYLYYSSAYKPAKGVAQTVIQVARAAKIDGEYLTYSDRGTWEKEPLDAKIIVYPFHKAATPPEAGYGAGQQSVVVKDGKLVMFYTDDTLGDRRQYVYKSESNDPVKWVTDPTQKSNLASVHSPDIKYDAQLKKFFMLRFVDAHTDHASLATYFSANGLNWSAGNVSYVPEIFPNFANNPGVLSNPDGSLIKIEKPFIMFAAPKDPFDTVDHWGYWNMYQLNLPPLNDQSGLMH